ncbi:toxin-antitoxin system protein [Rosenbergiella epipactidis]|uniref:toxin-antitoxin system protein n=1 Tax=Rosenbergiella epipactidis TaxID=1544694 RepID=UPI001F4DE9F6|nr:toxin-antitoxin system protein [Rosenbergiella epipactidis]
MPTAKKKTNRYFNGVETTRLIMTVDSSLVAQVDDLIGVRKYGHITHPCRRNRAEFVRQTIAEKLARDSNQ